ncbi:hypothetical protein PQX77_006221 [Marasmius sp. AFHP31]|nr:hypothetical protein PQX77_006221 [Marasmius sp. AFHP31]
MSHLDETKKAPPPEIEKVEDVMVENANQPGEERIVVTDEDSRRIVRKTDLHMLSLLCWVYFLQILDKVIIGYSAVFGLKQDANLVGNQYSSIGSVGYYAQMAAQPVGAYVLVKFPVKVVMPAIVFLWGASLCGMAGSTNFTGLMVSRFFLGWFEALCIPLFSMITASWYRRVEQPFLIDNSPAEARFLSPEDRLKAVERLRSNNTGLVSHKFKWKQVLEVPTEVRSYLFFGMTLFVNMGASTSTVFGPLVLQGLVGFGPRQTMLMNVPFGALQFAIIMFASWIAVRYKNRSIILASAMAPVVAGVAILYAVPREKSNTGPLLTGYYLISFLFSANPLLISWIISNVAGQSKKATYMALYNFSSSFAHIFNPYLFEAKTAPSYLPGLRSVMIVFCVLILLVGLTALDLAWLNKRKEKQRVQNGKPAKLKDLSMAHKFDNSGTVDNQKLGENAFRDMTDKACFIQENDEFIYVL